MIFYFEASKNLTDFWLSYWTQTHHESNLSARLGEFGHSLSKVAVLNPYGTFIYNPIGFHTHRTHHIENKLLGYQVDEHDESRFFFAVYGALCLANTFFTLLRAFCFAYSGIRAGKFIHECLIKNLSKVR